MSLYIGKDSSGNSTIHVTSSQETIERLKSGILPSTVFTSGLDFVTCKVFELSDIRIYSISSTGGHHSGIVGTLSSEAITYISSRFTRTHIPVVLVAVGGKIIFNHGKNFNMQSYIWSYMDTNMFPPGAYANHHSPIPSNVYKYKAVAGDYSSPMPIHLLVTSISSDSYSGNLMNMNNLMFTARSDISITKEDIVVKGSSLKNTTFMTLKNVNSLLSFSGNSLGDKISVLNNEPSSSVKFIANNTNISLENEHGEKIFNASSGQISTFSAGTLSFTNIDSLGNEKYVNNITAGIGKGCFFSTINPAGIYPTPNTLYSSFYIGSTQYTDIATLTVTASNTTYKYQIKVDKVGGVYRYIFRRQLIYMGSDGNHGFPPEYIFNKYMLLN